MLDAFFLSVAPDRRFCILTQAEAAPRRGIVYVHPFAEEMNKSRRMAARQARRLAAEGFAVLQIDLYGCGDSSGDFSQARWCTWKRDIHAGVAWLSERLHVPVTLWGLRLGAALAVQVAQDAGIDHLLLWQPVTDGTQFMAQFLRLRLASEMLASGAATTVVRELTEELARGNSLEIGGYELHPELAAAVERIKLESLAPAVKKVNWMEVVADRTVPLRPAARRVLDSWRERGVRTEAALAAGEPFWSTIEIAECEELLTLTTEAMKAVS